MKSAVGLADLARVIFMLPLEVRDEVAALLGFRRVVSMQLADDAGPSPPFAADAQLEGHEAAPPEGAAAASERGPRVDASRDDPGDTRWSFTTQPLRPLTDDDLERGRFIVGSAVGWSERVRGRHGRAGFFRVEAAVERDPVAQVTLVPEATLTREDLNSKPRASLPSAPRLAAWSTLWSRLQVALQSLRPGRDPDVAALVRAWSRGQGFDRMPRRVRRTWTASASLWIDRSSRLTPFWDDQEMVYQQLVRLCGVAAIRPRTLDALRQSSLASWCGDLVGPYPPDPAVRVLVLGDLGLYGTSTDRARWLRTALRLRRERVRVAALVPCPTNRWDRELARVWNATPWERASTADARGTPEARAEALLRLIAPTALAQPGLLRALRRLLPAADADASTEVDVWRHADVQAADASGLVLKADASARWREQFAAAVPAAIRSEVSRLIDRWHGNWRAELLHAETINWIALGLPDAPGSSDEAEAFIQRVAATVCANDTAKVDVTMVNRYGRHLLGAFPDSGYPRWPALKKVWSAAFADMPDARLPTTIEPHELILGTRSTPQSWTAQQCGNSLLVVPEATGATAGGRPGSTVVRIRTLIPEVWVQRSDDARATRTTLTTQVEIPLIPGENLTLRTDCDQVTLRVWERAPWATAAGRDRYGLWAAFEVRGVRQRMRWVPPGRFLMGSPATEVGRSSLEGPQHLVTITRGYWLGETPVTQSLWRAVMRSNPSRFTSDDRPVEQVTWDECLQFMSRLNRRLEGFAARLPTEAEWERACRAGTTSATWLGDITLRGTNDAPEITAIAWYAGNSGTDFDLDSGHNTRSWPEQQHPHTSAGTHPVGLLRANPYGLYDILGNVFEWCEDAAEHAGGRVYNSEPVEDPVSRAPSASRVYKGGSWSSSARFVRAASRFVNPRGYRFDDLGFRLASQ